jgi:hypothetical protein
MRRPRSPHFADFPPMSTHNLLQTVLCLPFDVARMNYAAAVRAGLIERSLLASARFGRLLNTMEVIVLGPLARRR